MQDTKAYGTPVPGWKPPAVPGAPLLRGHFMQLERLEPEAHAHALFAANAEDVGAWDYLPYGPFSSEAGFIRWLSEMAVQADPFFYAIRCLDSGQVGGVAAYLRITPQAGTIEIGHINLAARLQRTRAASEALMAMIGWAFEAGYRRVEWKCDALNMPSRHAAQRLGLSFEGVFRQAAVIKGRNRDTAWFAATDREWKGLNAAYSAWLAPENFDGGRQRERLSDLTRLVRVSSDPALSE